MNIRTTPDNTGRAPRDCVWQAMDDDTYDGSGSPIGMGATEEEAIADLMEQMPVTCPRCSAQRKRNDRPVGCRDVMCPREIWP